MEGESNKDKKREADEPIRSDIPPTPEEKRVPRFG